MYACTKVVTKIVKLLDRNATAALEFALVAPVLFVLMFGTLELGLVWWTKNALQVTAAMTARCISLASCSDPVSFAVNSAGTWATSTSINRSDVTYTTNSSCYGGAAVYAKVTINCVFWGGSILPPPLSNLNIAVSACYPML